MNTLENQENIIAAWLKSHEAELIQTADYIFHHPELAYQETLSSKCLADLLERNGFTISRKTAGIDTAFTAEWGSGKPVIGFLAEYDALAELGHACGHNLLGTGAAAAACALKEDMQASHTAGTIRVYGCPAEEIMSGKIIMNRQGIFDDLDVAVTWHPFDSNRVSNDIWQSQDIKNYIFHGVSAHASKSPENGRSALDAAELMNIGVNYLREHVADDVRMHYAYIDNGLPANVVPDFAKTNYFIRSSKRARTEDASRRVDDCARGAAMMTGTSVEIELVGSCKEMKVNRVLAELYYDSMTRIPTPKYKIGRHYPGSRPRQPWYLLRRAGAIRRCARTNLYWNRRFRSQPHGTADHHQCRHHVQRHAPSPLGCRQTGRHEHRPKRNVLCCQVHGRRHKIIA